MGTLVGPGELTAYLQQPVRADSEREAIRMAEGWLRGAVPSPDPWPDPPPEDLRAWAMELAVMAYDNPRGLASRTVDDDTWAVVVTRRREILAAAKARYPSGGGPLHSFPPAPTPI